MRMRRWRRPGGELAGSQFSAFSGQRRFSTFALVKQGSGQGARHEVTTHERSTFPNRTTSANLFRFCSSIRPCYGLILAWLSMTRNCLLSPHHPPPRAPFDSVSGVRWRLLAVFAMLLEEKDGVVFSLGPS